MRVVMAISIVFIFVVAGILFVIVRGYPNRNDWLPTYVLAAENGYDGTLQEWSQELQEKSAYDVASENGYKGSHNQWRNDLDSVKENIVTIMAADCDEQGKLTLTLSDKTVLNIGTVAQGGITDESATQEIAHIGTTEQGHLIVTFADGTQMNFGTMVGAYGVIDDETASETEGTNQSIQPVVTDIEIEDDGSLSITLDGGQVEKVPTKTDVQATNKTNVGLDSSTTENSKPSNMQTTGTVANIIDKENANTTKPVVENTVSDSNETIQKTSTTTVLKYDPLDEPVDMDPNATYHTVVFRDYDRTILKLEEVEDGKSATAPIPSVQDGYVFVRWDSAFDCVTANMVVSPVYVSSTAPMLIVPQVVGKAGETITVDVTIANNPGLLGAIITYDYDTDLSLVGAKAGPAFEELDVSFPQYSAPFTMFCDGLLEPAKRDGVIASLSFTIPTTAQEGQVYTITASYEAGDIVDSQLRETELTTITGTVIVQ